MPCALLQELGGWKSDATVRRYAHMSVKHLQPFADQLIFAPHAGIPAEPQKTVVSMTQNHPHRQSTGACDWW
jgi:hypothetical protein